VNQLTKVREWWSMKKIKDIAQESGNKPNPGN
jgi:hypothetical protein